MLNNGSLKTHWTTNDVIQMLPVTARMLQWWDENGVVSPTQQHHIRTYSRNDVKELSIVCGLRRKGLSLAITRSVLKEFRAKAPSALTRFIVAPLDGRKVKFADSLEQAGVKALESGAVVVVSVKEIIR